MSVQLKKSQQFPVNPVDAEYQAKQYLIAKRMRATAEWNTKRGYHKAAADCMYQATLCAMKALGAYRGADV